MKNDIWEKDHIPISNINILHIEMGYQCNVRCIMCFQNDFSSKYNINHIIYKQKLVSIYPYLHHLNFQGGEPTLIKQCKEMLDYIVSQYPQIRLATMTNGTRFDDDWINIFINQGDFVNFSLNASSLQTHNKIMLYSDWDKIINNIKNMVNKKKSVNSNLEICSSFVIIPENIHEMSSFIEFSYELGIDHVRFFTDISRFPKDVGRTLIQIKNAYITKEKYSTMKVSGIEIFENSYLSKTKRSKFEKKIYGKVLEGETCESPWRSLFVDHDGNVSFCCMTDFQLGNLYENSIQEIWNNEKASGFREKIQNNDYQYCSPTCASNKYPVFKTNNCFSLTYANKLIKQCIKKINR